jgi:hypothetical protein
MSVSKRNVTRPKKSVNLSERARRRAAIALRGQVWRRAIDASVAAARDRARPPRTDVSPSQATLMLREAEATRAIVTQLGPSARSWTLAADAADLERRAFAAQPTLRPGWAAS